MTTAVVDAANARLTDGRPPPPMQDDADAIGAPIPSAQPTWHGGKTTDSATIEDASGEELETITRLSAHGWDRPERTSVSVRS